jgi:hypothetical protein
MMLPVSGPVLSIPGKPYSMPRPSLNEEQISKALNREGSMATNPRIPEPRDPAKVHDDHAVVHDEDSVKRRFPVPVAILIVAAVILALLIWYLPRTPVAQAPPAGAVVPAQPTGGQIQLTNINLATSPVGDQVYIDAILHNAGNTTINGVLVNVSFPGSTGTAASVQAPVTALTGANNTVTESLIDHPIPPNGQQAVRITVPNAPEGWNHQLPGLTVATVTAVSAEGGSTQPSQ